MNKTTKITAKAIFFAKKWEGTATEVEVNVTAAGKMARLHDALKNCGYTGHPLEVYLVRLLFCLFAEDTNIFPKHAFLNYIEQTKKDGSDLAEKIARLFQILNTPESERKKKKNLPPELLNFQYINGNLFEEKLDIADFTDKMRDVLIECAKFDWSHIFPAIFGAMFQGVMDKEKRREIGAHYTSEENILKVINPLFMDDLRAEFERVKSSPKKLLAFHKKIAPLTFLDPACGCGNFLIISYREFQSDDQKNDILSVYLNSDGKPYKTAGKIDYVAAVWKPLFELFSPRIDFAYRTFKWSNEAGGKAAVHCVIIGFSANGHTERISLFETNENCDAGQTKRQSFIYENDGSKIKAANINPYLVDAPNIFITSRRDPICDVPKMITGNRPADGGHLIIEDDDLANFIKADPRSKPYIRRFMGAEEYINNKKRWCLWLVGVNAALLRQMPEVMKRITACKKDSENAPDAGSRDILDERAKYPNDSLADLYDPLTMPPKLLKAHRALDKAVMKLYKFRNDFSEASIVAALLENYQKFVKL